MITLKKYLWSGPPDYTKVIDVLLDGMAEHSVCAKTTDLQDFLTVMRGIREPVETEPSLERLLVIAGASIQALAAYNARTTLLIRRQAAELQSMISMLAQTVITITGGGERATTALYGIKQELEQASDIEDIQSLKRRLGECLEKVRSEASRQQTEAGATVLELQRQIEIAESAGCTDPEIDSVTGLPRVAVAKAAFAEGLKSNGRKYVVTMVVDRLQRINARFGAAIGDQVLKDMAKHIQAKVIGQGDGLFRWDGPTFVALVSRQESIDIVRAGLKRVLDIKLDNEVDLGKRTVLLPLSVSWNVMALIAPVANVPLFIDRFVATRVQQDFC